MSISNQFTLDENKTYLENAIELNNVLGGLVTVSKLQRHLRIGYPRAARLMDELEAQGLVGKAHAWERAPVDLDANWICSNCRKLDFSEIPDQSRTCRGPVAERIEQEVEAWHNIAESLAKTLAEEK